MRNCKAAGSVVSSQDKRSEWFRYENIDVDPKESIVDMADWLDKPAGKHGWLRMEGDKLIFSDGTPAKFWGTNVTEERVYNRSDKMVEPWRLAKYGVNAVRFHKFTWMTTGVVKPDGKSTDLDEEKMRGMDQYFSELKEKGIYVIWSHIFGHMVSEADALESGFVGQQLFYEFENSYTLVNFAEDLQNLVIQLTVNLLNHKNPYTGLRYADDPALAVIELQNEDNIFFCMQSRADRFPYYRKLINRMFCDWLTKKYKTSENLLEAWGKEAIDEGESLEEGTIYAYSAKEVLGIKGFEKNMQKTKRLLDSARFMYEVQNQYYSKYIKAIRETGYQGAIIGSPWIAGDGIPHWYNLHSDYLAGIIDRHAYWGGGDMYSHEVIPGKVIHQSMLSQPGLGLLRVGLDKVIDRPFFVSEWMSTPANEWLTEAPFLIAAYGMGLQGWSGSFSYSMDHSHNRYNANIPTHLGTYPALARMVYRGDVKEGDVAAIQEINIENFQKSSDVPDAIAKEILAAGKMGVCFKGESVHNGVTVDIHRCWDQEAKVITSSTGQLVWDYSSGGAVKLDTPGTQGIVGFVSGKTVELSDVVIKEIDTLFTNILITGLGRETVKDSKRLLLTALARCRNTGMEFNEDGTELLKVGHAPLLIEPVQATILLKQKSSIVVNVLDEQGVRTGRTIEITPTAQGVEFRIDGRHQAFWYEICIRD